MIRTLLLLSSAVLSIGVTIALGPMWLLACFALCLVTLLLATKGVGEADEPAMYSAAGIETVL